MGNVIVAILLTAAVLFALGGIVRNRKKGKSMQCGGDCSRCGGGCH